ncbi:MAG: hypothetical protein HRU19_27915 [Pseudobacteriovorax sp.]|nr:hypothetical protein [Pseudobacteriovorax sp.]
MKHPSYVAVGAIFFLCFGLDLPTRLGHHPNVPTDSHLDSNKKRQIPDGMEFTVHRDNKNSEVLDQTIPFDFRNTTEEVSKGKPHISTRQTGLSNQLDRSLLFKEGKIENGKFNLDEFSVTWRHCHEEQENIPESVNDLILEATEAPLSNFNIADYNWYLTTVDGYIQISANWNYRSPASYKIVALKSPDQDFLDHVIKIEDHSFGIFANIHEAIEVIEQFIQKQISHGAKRGARTIVLVDELTDVANGQQIPSSQATLINGEVTGLRWENTSCFKRRGLVCFCEH